jgi:hypothetical protein
VIQGFYTEGNKKYSVILYLSKSDEYGSVFILKNKSYVDFYKLLEKYYNLQSCVQPIISILSRTVKQKKEEGKEIIVSFN